MVGLKRLLIFAEWMKFHVMYSYSFVVKSLKIAFT